MSLENIISSILNDYTLKHNISDCILSVNFTVTTYTINITIIVCDLKTQTNISNIFETKLNATYDLKKYLRFIPITPKEPILTIKIDSDDEAGAGVSISTTMHIKSDENIPNRANERDIWRIFALSGLVLISCCVLFCGIVFVKYRIARHKIQQNQTNMTLQMTKMGSISSTGDVISSFGMTKGYTISNVPSSPTFQSSQKRISAMSNGTDIMQPGSPSVNPRNSHIQSSLNSAFDIVNTNDKCISEDAEYDYNNSYYNDYHHKNNENRNSAQQKSQLSQIVTNSISYHHSNKLDDHDVHTMGNDYNDNQQDNDDDMVTLDKMWTTKGDQGVMYHEDNNNNVNIRADEFIINGEEDLNDNDGEFAITTAR